MKSLWELAPPRGQCGKAAAIALAASIPLCLALIGAHLLDLF